MEDIVGYIAAFLTTSAFIPQTLKVIRTQDTRALSLPMYLLFTTGVAFWLAYGVLLMRWPIIIPNTFTLIMSSIILWVKLRTR